jgi:alpha-galactosidase/6-phospho-beta-glucosidase family protein
MSVAIAVVGGGSSMFVPGLIRRLIEIPCYSGAQLRLMDIDADRVRVMRDLGTQLAAAEGSSLDITATTDRRAALSGADFVIVAISVGGMNAWESDIELPAKYGVFMHIADSIGPGGIFRALRNTPVVASVVRDLAELSPAAMVFNYTNPASANMIAMARSSGVRSVSLCSCSPLPFDRAWLAAQTGTAEDEIDLPLRVGGINHCTGIMSLRLRDGRDAIPMVAERSPDPLVRWAIRTFGVVPYCWAHWAEFFPQLQRLEQPYQGRAQGLAMRYGRRIYDMEAQRDRVSSWERVAATWAGEDGPHRLSDLPHGPEDDGIVVAEVIASVIESRRDTFVINTINDGLITNLPATAAVEVPAVVDAEGIHPMGIGALPPGLAAVLSRHALVQELTAEAALTGRHNLLRQAMTADPLLDATLEPAEIEALTREMLAANAAFLPQFDHAPDKEAGHG